MAIDKSRKGTPRKGDLAMDVKVPQGKLGNTKADQKWLEEQIEAGLIEDIGDDESDIPFGALKRWTGDKADIGSYWQLPDKPNRCNARAKVRDGEGRYVVNADNEPILRPCYRPRIKGGNVCVTHGGGITKVRQAATLRLAGAADSLIGQLIKIAMDPSVDPKARVQAINSALDRAGVNHKIEVSVDSPQWKSMLDDMFGEWGEDKDDEE